MRNFARYLRPLFYRKLSGDCFCSTENYFKNKKLKNPIKKKKKKKKEWKHLVKKATTYPEKRPLNLSSPLPPINLATWTFIFPETLHQLLSAGVLINQNKVLNVTVFK